jgi:hypothetical protein
MSSEIKGKMVIPFPIYIYTTFHFQESSWNNFFLIPHLANLIELGDSFRLPSGWLPVSRKSPRDGEVGCFLK